MKNKGKLYLIPTFLSASNNAHFIPLHTITVLKKTRYFLAENERTARRFISALKADIRIEDLHFDRIDKNTSDTEIPQLMHPISEGNDLALLTEAGLPCIADPGQLAVRFAHQHQIKIVPLPGSSAIPLAIAASGFNGQNFVFHGYLSRDKSALKNQIVQLEKEAHKGSTQTFIETPYRNLQLFEAIIRHCQLNTVLSIASDLTGSNEYIHTQTIQQWKGTSPPIHKVPTIFSLGIFS